MEKIALRVATTIARVTINREHLNEKLWDNHFSFYLVDFIVNL
jgi:hypothetical protein